MTEQNPRRDEFALRHRSTIRSRKRDLLLWSSRFPAGSRGQNNDRAVEGKYDPTGDNLTGERTTLQKEDTPVLWQLKLWNTGCRRLENISREATTQSTKILRTKSAPRSILLRFFGISFAFLSSYDTFYYEIPF
ncbi:MAG: hypothetical protein L6W00_04225 [Lentisphaeria bacterium]|nr:MAG: hypothetical protein L6W00_04225 [Lentisphaeria bacterium]